MIFPIGAAFVLVGIVLWLWTVKAYLNDPGYGGFDMNTAPAFDFGWFKGAVAIGFGAGLMTHTWWIGLATGVAGFLTSMLVKPLLGTAVAHRIEKRNATSLASQPPKGLEALRLAEQEVKAKTGTESNNSEETRDS